jgi:hypothetical protein
MLRRLFRPKAPEPVAPPEPDPPKDPLRLKCGSLEFLVGFTTRRAIESRLGPAVEYPAPGWKTWAAAGTRGDTWIISAIYRGQVLIGIEHYMAKTANLPRDTPPANGIYTLVPGDVGLGSRIGALPERFRKVPGKQGGAQAIVYQDAFESRWPHGIAFVCGNDGRIERIALYANHEMPTIDKPAPKEE